MRLKKSEYNYNYPYDLEFTDEYGRYSSIYCFTYIGNSLNLQYLGYYNNGAETQKWLEFDEWRYYL